MEEDNTIQANASVFVISTYTDLIEYRQAVREGLDELNLTVYGMEDFREQSENPLDLCRKNIGLCKVFIGIVAMRYGSVPEDSDGRSFIHYEYDEARRLELPSLIYLCDEDNYPILPKHMDKGPKSEQLIQFKENLKINHTVDHFTTPEGLKTKICEAIVELLAKQDREQKQREQQQREAQQALHQAETELSEAQEEVDDAKKDLYAAKEKQKGAQEKRDQAKQRLNPAQPQPQPAQLQPQPQPQPGQPQLQPQPDQLQPQPGQPQLQPEPQPGQPQLQPQPQPGQPQPQPQPQPVQPQLQPQPQPGQPQLQPQPQPQLQPQPQPGQPQPGQSQLQPQPQPVQLQPQPGQPQPQPESQPGQPQPQPQPVQPQLQPQPQPQPGQPQLQPQPQPGQPQPGQPQPQPQPGQPQPQPQSQPDQPQLQPQPQPQPVQPQLQPQPQPGQPQLQPQPQPDQPQPQPVQPQLQPQPQQGQPQPQPQPQLQPGQPQPEPQPGQPQLQPQPQPGQPQPLTNELRSDKDPQPPKVDRIRYSPGDKFRDGDDYPLMVVVPAGKYIMGSPLDELGRKDSEWPPHKIRIAKSFAVGVYPVMFAEWDKCIEDGGCGGYRPEDQGWGRGKSPVIFVNWDDAQEYVKWLRDKAGEGYRLLSEAEWEYVCRAGTTTPFYCGDTIATRQANYDGSFTYGRGGKKGRNRQRTIEVGSFEANGWGLYDVHGNVREWVEDCWHSDYEQAPGDGSAWQMEGCKNRVRRGGAFGNKPKDVRSAYRGWGEANNRNYFTGFRIAKTL